MLEPRNVDLGDTTLGKVVQGPRYANGWLHLNEVPTRYEHMKRIVVKALLAVCDLGNLNRRPLWEQDAVVVPAGSKEHREKRPTYTAYAAFRPQQALCVIYFSKRAFGLNRKFGDHDLHEYITTNFLKFMKGLEQEFFKGQESGKGKSVEEAQWQYGEASGKSRRAGKGISRYNQEKQFDTFLFTFIFQQAQDEEEDNEKRYQCWVRIYEEEQR